MEFFNLYRHGFARVAAVPMPVTLADPARNAATITRILTTLDPNVAVAVFPELCLTGATLGDLYHSDALLDAAKAAITQVAEASRCLSIIGAPIRRNSRIYNCAVAVQNGEILAVIPKRILSPGERRFFAEPPELDRGPGPIFTVPGTDLRVIVEIGDESLAQFPAHAAQPGVVVANPYAAPATLGAVERRVAALAAEANRCSVAFVAAGAGLGESSTESAWPGAAAVLEPGAVLAQTAGYRSPRPVVSEVHLAALPPQPRPAPDLFSATLFGADEVSFTASWTDGKLPLTRQIARYPFVPDDPSTLAAAGAEVFEIQIAALSQRIRAIGTPKIIIGVSGGLDSTQALLAAALTMDRLGRPRTEILAYTMPGFATSTETKDRATRLAQSVGVSFAELDIRPSAQLMLDSLEHGGEYDVTFENVQAGLRADYLFRLANHHGGIVLGTGDLSEEALGWCTYGVGDQMSHYNVNAGLPKTLMKHVLRWAAASGSWPAETAEVLHEILAAEISPELIPGTQIQATQDTIGPYDLQDFNLYYAVKYGFAPSKIAFLAEHAWADAGSGVWPFGTPEEEKVAYGLPEIKHWLGVFARRFYQLSQFKRSAAPNGPALFELSLSPRDGWIAPSDVGAEVWLAEVAAIPD